MNKLGTLAQVQAAVGNPERLGIIVEIGMRDESIVLETAVETLVGPMQIDLPARGHAAVGVAAGVDQILLGEHQVAQSRRDSRLPST